MINHLAGDYQSPEVKAVAERLDELGIKYYKVGPDGDNPRGISLVTPCGRSVGTHQIFAYFGKLESLKTAV